MSSRPLYHLQWYAFTSRCITVHISIISISSLTLIQLKSPACLQVPKLLHTHLSACSDSPAMVQMAHATKGSDKMTIKTFTYHSFKYWLGRLLARLGLEVDELVVGASYRHAD